MHPELMEVWSDGEISAFKKDGVPDFQKFAVVEDGDEAVVTGPEVRTRNKDVGTAEQPLGLKLKLLPYQKEGLAWMIHQEHSSVCLISNGSFVEGFLPMRWVWERPSK